MSSIINTLNMYKFVYVIFVANYKGNVGNHLFRVT